MRLLTRAKSFAKKHPVAAAVGGIASAIGLVYLLPKPPRYPRIGSERYRIFDAFIEEASIAYGIPVAFIRAVIRVESDFQPAAVSRVGAMGLMQIMPGTAERCGAEVAANPYDPRLNILCGTSVLSGNIIRYDGDLSLALAAYNAGPGRAHNPPLATRIYTARVLGYFRSATEEGYA